MPQFTDILFFGLAGLVLLFGLLTVANPFSRNPVTSAMFLVLTIVSLAGLYVLLHAFFLAAIQVLVYAGAVMVLFLFVIMLLDLKEEEHRRLKSGILAVGSLAVVAFVGILLITLLKAKPTASAVAGRLVEGDTVKLGTLLFENWLLPFEILSVLLLVAMVGVILLTKKDLK